MEEHITLLRELGSEYIGHLVVENGNAIGLSLNILEFLESNKIDLNSLKGIGCDGTPVNTGVHGGTIKLLEDKLQKPLPWLICLFHANELLLRHLFLHVDGRQVGPRSYIGSISKLLKNCEELPLVDFQPIEYQNFPECENPEDLSTDQKYLFLMCKAVISGHCSEELSRMNPGNISHARWLTTANRILRLHVSTDKPGKKLQQLVLLIIKLYAPLWFSIKPKPLCFEGAKHVMQMIQLSRCLDDETRKVIDPVIQRNAYYAHSENILMAMSVDERPEVRIEALRKLSICRQTERHSKRIFTVPKINFQAHDYVHLIDWNTFTEPPLLRDISNEDLQNFVLTDPAKLKTHLMIPCHSQAVERCVKLVTAASQSVCGNDRRDAYIRTTVQSRLLMPSFKSKKDFCFFDHD